MGAPSTSIHIVEYLGMLALEAATLVHSELTGRVVYK